MIDIHKNITYHVDLMYGNIKLMIEDENNTSPTKRVSSFIQADLYSLNVLRQNANELTQRGKEKPKYFTRMICGTTERVNIDQIEERMRYLCDTYPEEMI